MSNTQSGTHESLHFLVPTDQEHRRREYVALGGDLPVIRLCAPPFLAARNQSYPGYKMCSEIRTGSSSEGKRSGSLLAKSRAWPRDSKNMVRPERFELPTFWFVVRFYPTRKANPNHKCNKTLENRAHLWHCFASLRTTFTHNSRTPRTAFSARAENYESCRLKFADHFYGELRVHATSLRWRRN
jgi:hypothetical protein